MGCGASSGSQRQANDAVPRQRRTAPSTPPAAPLPQAFRQCATPASEQRDLTPAQIGDMLGEIQCCIDDQTDQKECREGELELERKADAIDRLQCAQETGDIGLLTQTI